MGVYTNQVTIALIGNNNLFTYSNKHKEANTLVAIPISSWQHVCLLPQGYQESKRESDSKIASHGR